MLPPDIHSSLRTAAKLRNALRSAPSIGQQHLELLARDHKFAEIAMALANAGAFGSKGRADTFSAIAATLGTERMRVIALLSAHIRIQTELQNCHLRQFGIELLRHALVVAELTVPLCEDAGIAAHDTCREIALLHEMPLLMNLRQLDYAATAKDGREALRLAAQAPGAVSLDALLAQLEMQDLLTARKACAPIIAAAHRHAWIANPIIREAADGPYLYLDHARLEATRLRVASIDSAVMNHLQGGQPGARSHLQSASELATNQSATKSLDVIAAQAAGSSWSRWLGIAAVCTTIALVSWLAL